MNFDANEALERLHGAGRRSLTEGTELAFRLQDEAFDAGRKALGTVRDMHDAAWICLHEGLNLFETNAKSTRKIVAGHLRTMELPWNLNA